jgi:2'-5' RNA ligase
VVAPFLLQIGKIGVFPDAGKPRVLWLGATGGIEKLTALQIQLERDFTALGFPQENRPFQAHLTLGRNRNSHILTGIIEIVTKYNDFIAGEFNCQELILFQSKLTTEGPIYTKLENFSFSG